MYSSEGGPNSIKFGENRAASLLHQTRCWGRDVLLRRSTRRRMVSKIQARCNVMWMWSLRWHFTNRSVTGAPYSIKVTVCHTAGHYGIEYDDGGLEQWSTFLGRGGTAAAMAQNEQTAEEHSTIEQQPPGRLNHPAWCVVWTVQPASTLKHSEDADVNLRRQSGGGSQRGMMAPCR